MLRRLSSSGCLSARLNPCSAGAQNLCYDEPAPPPDEPAPPPAAPLLAVHSRVPSAHKVSDFPRQSLADRDSVAAPSTSRLSANSHAPGEISALLPHGDAPRLSREIAHSVSELTNKRLGPIKRPATQPCVSIEEALKRARKTPQNYGAVHVTPVSSNKMYSRQVTLTEGTGESVISHAHSPAHCTSGESSVNSTSTRAQPPRSDVQRSVDVNKCDTDRGSSSGCHKPPCQTHSGCRGSDPPEMACVSDAPTKSAGGRRCTSSWLCTLLGWQVLAIVLAGTMVFSNLLAKSLKVSIPVTQSLPHYTVLAIVYTPLLIRRRKIKPNDLATSPTSLSLAHSHTLETSARTNEIDPESPTNSQTTGTTVAQTDNNTPFEASHAAAKANSHRRNRSWLPELRVAWWKYALISLADVEGNFFVVLAFQYTSITSVSLLSASTVVFVAILSRMFLGMRFRALHVFAIAGCIVGLGVLVYSDLLVQNDGHTERSWQHLALGDALVVISGASYAVSNVSQEYVIKTFDSIEFLACLGVFGTAISAAQALVLERSDVMYALQHRESDELWLYIAGFTACMFAIYSTTPYMLARSSATAMNLSFLVVDFWAVLANFFIFHAAFHWLRYIAFAVCLASLVGFHILRPPSSKLDERVQAQLECAA